LKQGTRKEVSQPTDNFFKGIDELFGLMGRMPKRKPAPEAPRKPGIRVTVRSEAMQRLMMGETITYKLPDSTIEIVFDGR
jgi:hypothetical protein